MARCYDCLTEDVSVRFIDEAGFEHWFCAEDWAAEQKFSDKVRDLLRDAARQLEVPGP
jgi:L-ribulose-5-phosphate 3-epimerase UlaE